MASPRGYRADLGLSYAKVERIAQRWRQFLAPAVKLDEPVPSAMIFETMHHVKVGAVQLNWEISELPLGVEGQTAFDNDDDEIIITLTPKTYRGLVEEDGRSRQTFHHEVCHAVVHTSQLKRISLIPHSVHAMQRGYAGHRFFRDTEWQADSFGSAFSMPAAGLAILEQRHGTLTAAMLMCVFQVSHEGAKVRLENYQKRRKELLAA